MFCYENNENNALHENTGVAHNGVESIDVKGHEVLTSIISNFPKLNKKIAHFCMCQLSSMAIFLFTTSINKIVKTFHQACTLISSSQIRWHIHHLHMELTMNLTNFVEEMAENNTILFITYS